MQGPKIAARGARALRGVRSLSDDDGDAAGVVDDQFALGDVLRGVQAKLAKARVGLLFDLDDAELEGAAHLPNDGWGVRGGLGARKTTRRRDDEDDEDLARTWRWCAMVCDGMRAAKREGA